MKKIGVIVLLLAIAVLVVFAFKGLWLRPPAPHIPGRVFWDVHDFPVTNGGRGVWEITLIDAPVPQQVAHPLHRTV